MTNCANSWYCYLYTTPVFELDCHFCIEWTPPGGLWNTLELVPFWPCECKGFITSSYSTTCLFSNRQDHLFHSGYDALLSIFIISDAVLEFTVSFWKVWDMFESLEFLKPWSLSWSFGAYARVWSFVWYLEIFSGFGFPVGLVIHTAETFLWNIFWASPWISQNTRIEYPLCWPDRRAVFV